MRQCPRVRAMNRVTLWVFLFAWQGAAFTQYIVFEPANDLEFPGFGASVAGVSDINGDGRGEFLVGSPDEDANEVFLYDGASQVPIRTLQSPSPPPPLESGFFGYSVTQVPDVNNDGYPELAVGAINEGSGFPNVRAGRVYVFDSQTGSHLTTLESDYPTVNHQISDFGFAIDGMSDINGNGSGEVIVGGFGTGRDMGGKVEVLDGRTGEELLGLFSPRAEVEPSNRFGECLSSVPDITGDATPEIIVGAPGEDTQPEDVGGGRAYLFDGSSGDILRQLVSPNDQDGGNFGGSVAGIPDTNLDGAGDFAVGARFEVIDGFEERTGRVYIFDGSSCAVLHTLESPFLQLERGGQFGYSVDGVPDSNENGSGDVLVGAPGENRAYLIDGLTGELLQEFSPYVQSSGSAVAWVTDVDGDGLNDYLFGAWTGRSSVWKGAAVLYLSTLAPSSIKNWNLLR